MYVAGRIDGQQIGQLEKFFEEQASKSYTPRISSIKFLTNLRSGKMVFVVSIEVNEDLMTPEDLEELRTIVSKEQTKGTK